MPFKEGREEKCMKAGGNREGRGGEGGRAASVVLRVLF